MNHIIDSYPADFIPIRTWYYEYGRAVFSSEKMIYYHTKPVQRELILAGAMAKVGACVFLHNTRFWPEYQRIIAEKIDDV